MFRRYIKKSWCNEQSHHTKKKHTAKLLISEPAADDLAEPKSVAVMGIDGSQAYAMTSPASTYACCTCPEAIQQKPCKHHIAWLLAQAPDDWQPKAIRVVVKMLGTRLGFVCGCTMEDSSNLFHALQALHCRPCDATVASPSPEDQAPIPDRPEENANVAGQDWF
jgi:uncharacterized Zn finger protein